MTQSRAAPINHPTHIGGLYAISPNELNSAVLLSKVAQALRGGAQIVQYRNKLADAILRQQQAQALRELTAAFNAVFIVNDDAQLAFQVDADGVHLGSNDGSVDIARQVLGQDKIVGVSCYNRRDLAQRAIEQGADYVAFGAFYSSTVKPDAVLAELTMLQQARAEIALPIVTIGGITLHNGAALVQAGANALAVISALWQSPDIESTARQFSNLFKQGIPA